MPESVEDFERRQLEEKISKMSPAELRAWQKEQCIFCKIVTGAQPAKKVYEDNECAVVLDIFPATPGHVLIIPKEHYMVMPQVPVETVKHMGMVAKAFAHATLRALGASGSTIFIANGGIAGQRAQHFMMHVIPRRENDGLGLAPGNIELNPQDEAKLVQFLPKVIDAINKAMRGEALQGNIELQQKPPMDAPPPVKMPPTPTSSPLPPEPEGPAKEATNTSEKKKLDDIASILLGK